MPSSTPTNLSSTDLALLLTTISTADPTTLRSTLRTLVDQNPSFARQAAELLLVEASDGAKNKTGKSKRKGRWEECEQCGEYMDFDDFGDIGEECFYHTQKECQVDWDADTWYDWDEDCNGPVDTDEHRMQFPEGFKWACCGEPTYSTGCVPTTHKIKEVNKK